MRRISRKITLLAVVLIAIALASPAVSSAQSFGSSFGGLETVFGPFLPANGWGNSFRSEVGAGISAVYVQRAGMLVGKGRFATQPEAFNLLRNSDLAQVNGSADLDRFPAKLDIYGKLRFWRGAFNIHYTYFPIRSRNLDLGTLDLSALKLGLEADVVQLNWLSVGAVVEFALTEPTFYGAFVPYSFTPVGSLVNGDAKVNYTHVSGKKPNTAGAYIRYMPPEIMNFPLHIEAYYKAPLSGSKLTQWGGALVFRPQIYRFDTAIKLTGQKNTLSFTNDPSPPDSEIRMDLEWAAFGIEAAIYF